MALLQRLIILFPLALSIVGIVLSALCLFAGHEEGFMEEYAIARVRPNQPSENNTFEKRKLLLTNRQLNTSMVGHDLFDLTSDGEAEEEAEADSDDDDDEDSSWFDDITGDISDTVSDAFDDVQGLVEDTLNNVTASAADAVAEALGISEWFSIHVMTACQGMYEPDASASDPGLNTTDCTGAAPDSTLRLLPCFVLLLTPS
jgi:hypothetical protein